MRLIRLKSVVLPAPFGPMMVNTSPSFTSKPTPSTALTPPKAIEKIFDPKQAHRRRSDFMKVFWRRKESFL